MTQVLVVYKQSNTDAWCGAWIMDRCFGGVQLVPSSDDSPLPCFDNRTVFCIGMQYSESVVQDIASYAHRAVLIDNNEATSKHYMDSEICCHDVSRSSGMIAYDWCCYRGYIDNYSGSGQHNNRAIAKGMHWIVKYTQDKELSKGRMPNTELINLCIESYDYELRQWDMLATRASVTPDALISDGVAIDRYLKKHRLQNDTSIKN